MLLGPVSTMYLLVLPSFFVKLGPCDSVGCVHEACDEFIGRNQWGWC